MQYLTYEEYQAYGGESDETEFGALEFKARKRIDYLTDSRVQRMAEVPEAVKRCMMSIMGMEQAAGAEKQVTDPNVTSFNTDGYSETYGNAPGVTDANAIMVGTIKSMLYGEFDDYGVPLLYTGVRTY